MMQYQSPCQRHLICQISPGIFGFRSEGPHYIAMLQAYFDESGDPQDPNCHVVSVAAVVSDRQGWCAFEEQWEAVLKRYHVRGLHMKHYAHFQGEFKGWTKDRQEQFIRELLPIFHQHVRFGFECSIPMADWKEVMTGTFFDSNKEKRGPLMIPFRCCLDAIQFTNLLPQEEPIACQFEWNNFIIGEATATFEDWQDEFGQQDRFIEFGFLKKGRAHGLEAADLLAYEGRKELFEGYVKETGRPSRQVYRNLDASTKLYFYAINKDGLLSYLNTEYPLPTSDEETHHPPPE